MNYRYISRILGWIFLVFAGLMLLPVIVGLIYREQIGHFMIAIGVSALVGGILLLPKQNAGALYARDGFVIVGLGWIGISLVGALPFRLSGSIPIYTDALFETVSGLSTTGASILSSFDDMPRCDMFWRLFTHWIGGMGVLVFLMAILPMSGAHSMHIMRAEVPGPTVGKLVPRARSTARILYLIYITLTLTETFSLMIAGMDFYNALLHAFSTAGTGGFSTHPASIGGFNSLAIERIITAYMILFGINFNLYFLILIGSAGKALRNEELHCYLAVILASSVLIAVGLVRTGSISMGRALHEALFNVASVISTTGFGTVDFTQWPEYCKWILIILMFSGACAGSTGGGMKISRLMIMVRAIREELLHMLRPRRVARVSMDGQRVQMDTVRAAFTFGVLYLIILLIVSLAVSLDGFDLATSWTATLSCLSNIGPGMTPIIGPSGSFAVFSTRSKMLLCMTMLTGRLEIYPVLILFLPRTWNDHF